MSRHRRVDVFLFTALFERESFLEALYSEEFTPSYLNYNVRTPRIA